MNVSGIMGVPSGLNPPRFTTTPPLWVLKKLITVRVEYPVPLTVIVAEPGLTELTDIFSPIGTDTALLAREKLFVEPALTTTKVPGPVTGTFGPVAGIGKLSSELVSPASPGLSWNGPTLPPVQSQKRFTITPLAVSNP